MQDEQQFTLDILEEYQECKTWQGNFLEKWNTAYLLFRCWLDLDRWPFYSQIAVPQIFAATRTIVSRMMSIIFDVEPFVKVSPQHGVKDVKRVLASDTLQSLFCRFMKSMNYNSGTNIYNSCYQFFMEMALYGTGVMKYGWLLRVTEEEYSSYELDEEGLIVVENEKLKEKTIKKKRILHDSPVLTYIPLRNFFVPPDASPNNMPYCFLRRFTSVEDLKKEAKELGIKYKNLDKVENELAIETEGYPNIALSLVDQGPTTKKDGSLQVIEKWTEDELVFIAGDKLIYKGKNDLGRIPFLIGRTIVMPDEFYGMSVIEVTSRLQHELNAQRSMRMDNSTFRNQSGFIIRMGADIEPEEPKMRPNMIIRTSDPNNDIKPLTMQDSLITYQDMKHISSDIDGATGVNALVAGQVLPRQEQPTVVVALQKVADIVYNVMAKGFDETVLQPFGDGVRELCYMFWDGKMDYKAGQEIISITSDDFADEFTFKFSGTNVQDKAMMQGQKLKLANITIPLLQSLISMQCLTPQEYKSIALNTLRDLYEEHDISFEKIARGVDFEMSAQQQMMGQLGVGGEGGPEQAGGVPPGAPGGAEGKVTNLPDFPMPSPPTGDIPIEQILEMIQSNPAILKQLQEKMMSEGQAMQNPQPVISQITRELRGRM